MEDDYTENDIERTTVGTRQRTSSSSYMECGSRMSDVTLSAIISEEEGEEGGGSGDEMMSETCTMVDNLVATSNAGIDHRVLRDMMRITMLIYDFGETIVGHEKGQDTIEGFVQQQQNRQNEQNEQNEQEVKCSAATRKVLAEVAENVPSGRIHRFVSDPTTDAQVAVTVAEGQKRICVVFRGSESRSDWYYDLMLFKKRLDLSDILSSYSAAAFQSNGQSDGQSDGQSNGQSDSAEDVCVHSGFYTQLMQGGTYDKVATSVRELLTLHPDFSLYVTGHSLGGALATLFGYIFSHEVTTPVVVTSFASPRVGNYAWKEAFESMSNLYHHRITNRRDVVTAFPMYRYYHVGDNIQLADNGHTCFGREVVRGWFAESIFTCWSPAEHDCDLYYTRLMANEW